MPLPPMPLLPYDHDGCWPRLVDGPDDLGLAEAGQYVLFLNVNHRVLEQLRVPYVCFIIWLVAGRFYLLPLPYQIMDLGFRV